jgi:hypothetical protein
MLHQYKYLNELWRLEDVKKNMAKIERTWKKVSIDDFGAWDNCRDAANHVHKCECRDG